jgi:protoheme IX farnesyltransferase
MSASAVAPWALGYFGPVYGVTATLLSLVFIGFAAMLWQAKPEQERTLALRVFAFSIFYLFAIFTALAAESLMGFRPVVS